MVFSNMSQFWWNCCTVDYLTIAFIFSAHFTYDGGGFHRGRASVCDFLLFPPSGHILKICQTHAQGNEKICKIKISDTLLQHSRIQSGDRGAGAPEKINHKATKG